MLLKLCISVVFLIIWIYPLSYSQGIEGDLAEKTAFLPRTELINKKVIDSKDRRINLFSYRSELSKQEIVDFYRNYFSSIGLKEKKDPEQTEGLVSFNNGLIDHAQLNVYYTDENGITFFLLNTVSAKYAIATSSFEYKTPQEINFAPTSPHFTQALIGVGPDKKNKCAIYLTSRPIEEVVDFYLSKMSLFNWAFSDRRDHEGKSNIVEALAKGYNDSRLNGLGKEVAPQVFANLKTVTLLFVKKDSQCVVNIIQFLDSAEVLKSERIINPDVIAKHGNIFISVETDYQGMSQ